MAPLHGKQSYRGTATSPHSLLQICPASKLSSNVPDYVTMSQCAAVKVDSLLIKESSDLLFLQGLFAAERWHKHCKYLYFVKKYRTNVEKILHRCGERKIAKQRRVIFLWHAPQWSSSAAAVVQVITGNIFHAEPEKYFFEPLHLTFKGNTRTLHNLLFNCFCCTKSKRRKEKPYICKHSLCDEGTWGQTGYHGFHGP